MEKMKILVVEDEVVIADHLCIILERLGYEPLEPRLDFEGGLEAIEQEKPDLAILDIQLKGKKDGVDLAHEIRSRFSMPFIFLTSNSDVKTLERVKAVKPDAFLVKPFKQEDLFVSIELSLDSFSVENFTETESSNSEANDAIFVKQNGVFQKVRTKDISYLQSDRVYIDVYTKDEKKYLIRSSFNNITTKLPSYFLRVHRSFIVNLKCIESFDASHLRVGEQEIPISKSYRDVFMQKMEGFT